MGELTSLGGAGIDVDALIAQGPPKRTGGEKKARPGFERCPVCDGWIGSVAPEPYASFCRCAAVRRKAIEHLNEIDPGIRYAFPAYRPATPSQERALEAAQRVARGDEGDGYGVRGLILGGVPGVGKTMLAVAICREWLGRGGVCGYYNVVSLISRIQDTYGGDATDSRTSVILEVARRPLVVLDDLGKEHASPNVEGIIYELVDALYARRRTVVVATNLSPGEYEGRYDAAVRSRLEGMCETVSVEGADGRRR